MTIYVSLAFSLTMVPECCDIVVKPISAEKAAKIISSQSVVSAINPSHMTTIDTIQRKYGIALALPDYAPKVFCKSHDEIIVIQANLPRLAEGERHSPLTVEHATIQFRHVTVL